MPTSISMPIIYYLQTYNDFNQLVDIIYDNDFVKHL